MHLHVLPAVGGTRGTMELIVFPAEEGTPSIRATEIDHDERGLFRDLTRATADETAAAELWYVQSHPLYPHAWLPKSWYYVWLAPTAIDARHVRQWAEVVEKRLAWANTETYRRRPDSPPICPASLVANASDLMRTLKLTPPLSPPGAVTLFLALEWFRDLLLVLPGAGPTWREMPLVPAPQRVSAPDAPSPAQSVPAKPRKRKRSYKEREEIGVRAALLIKQGCSRAKAAAELGESPETLRDMPHVREAEMMVERDKLKAAEQRKGRQQEG